MKIELVRGAEARALAEDSGFQAAWRALVTRDEKLAFLQAPEFVLPWYRAYAAVWEPVLVLGRSQRGELAGLLALARKTGDGRLSHAGAEQAEYHGWLVEPGQDEALLLPALGALRRELGFSSWSWRWLPPGAALAWARSSQLAAAGIHALLEARPAPVWDLGDEQALARAYDNRSLRSKRNRYRRRGELRLERVREEGRTRALLPILAAQCDFRQEAVNGVRPFGDDPCKAEFFAARQVFSAANHFSVLWCGEEPLAFHFGGTDGRTCLLGLSAYAPPESKHSPGSLLLVELARALSEEGVRTLDLTPGTDAYKQRYATRQQELARLSLLGSRTRRTCVRALVRARSALVVRAGNGREGAERLQRWQRNLREVRDELRAAGPGAWLGRARASFFARRRLVCFRWSARARPAAAVSARVRLQAYADLQQGPPSPARRARLVEALARFSDGEVLYTLPGGCVGWRARESSGALAKALAAAGLGATELVVVEGGTPAERAECLARMLREAECAPEEVLACLAPGGAEEQARLGELGLLPVGRAHWQRFLGRDPGWRVELLGEVPRP